MAIRPNRQCLYVGHRQVPRSPAIASIRHGSHSRAPAVLRRPTPGFLALTVAAATCSRLTIKAAVPLCIHTRGGRCHQSPPSAWVPTAVGAHAIQTDRSNRFAFVPHIARLNDNVLEPPKNAPGPNAIYQFRFDETTQYLTPNTPPQLAMAGMLGQPVFISNRRCLLFR